MRYVFDIETDGLYWEATKVHVISLMALEGSTRAIESFSDATLPGVAGNLSDALKLLQEATELSGHNIIAFDLPVLKKLLNWVPNEKDTKITDTLVLSRLYWPDRPKPPNYTGKGGPHSLEAWGCRVGTAKPEHEDWRVFDSAMLRRNRSDVEINYSVYHILESEVKNHDWSVAVDLEHDVARILAQQEINGVSFNADYARRLVSDLGSKIQAIDDELHPKLPKYFKPLLSPIQKPFKVSGQYIKRVLDCFPELADSSDRLVGGPFSRVRMEQMNLGSMPQVKDYLLKTGWEPTEWNYSDDGLRSSPKLTEDSYGSIRGNIGKLIKDRLLFSHRRSQIQGWISAIREDGRITAGINPCGTNTGRARHHVVVNVPKAAKHVFFGWEMRSLFTASEGRTLVGHDADGLELRMLAHYMNDPEFTKAVIEGKKEDGTDIHSLNQRLAGLPTRDAAKTFIYALIYGAGDEKLGTIVGGDAGEGAILRKRFLDGLPALKRLLDRVRRASSKGWLRGLDGRKIWMRSYNGKIQKNKALNTLLQSAGAIVMKRSMVSLHESVQKISSLQLTGAVVKPGSTIGILKVLDMHDEAQADVVPEYVELYKSLAVKSIVDAGEYFNLRCPLAAEAKEGANWALTH